MAAERRLPAWIAPAVVLVLLAAQLHAFRWGVVTPDTVSQFEQALTGRYDDWHPPVMAWIWRWLGAARFGGAPLLLFDLALYWGGVLALAEALRQRGRAGGAAAVLALAASPIPFGQEGALLKDSLLAAAALAGVGLLAVREASPVRTDRVVLLAVACLLLAGMARINAALAVAPLLGVALWPGWRGWRWPLAMAAGGALALAAGWLVNEVALRPHHSSPMVSLLNFDLGGIVAEGGGDPYPQLGDAEARRLTAACYTQAIYNPADRDDCQGVEDGLNDWLDAHGVSPTRFWLGAIAAHPVAWARHRLAHVNLNWRFLVPTVPDDAVYTMSADNPDGLAFYDNGAAEAVSRAAQALARSPLGRPATWAALAAGLLAAGIGGGLARALAWSALLYAGGYAVASVAPDLRYNLWTLLAAGAACVLAWPDWRAARAGRRWLAIGPALAVMALEAAWLAGAS